jgi:hypothetical protein
MIYIVNVRLVGVVIFVNEMSSINKKLINLSYGGGQE